MMEHQSKQKHEKAIFGAFYATEANFAGEAVRCSPAADPPDVLCETSNGRRIAVGLGEWRWIRIAPNSLSILLDRPENLYSYENS